MLNKKMNVFAFYSLETKNWGTQWKEIVCTKAEEVNTVKYFGDLERRLVWKIRASSSLKTSDSLCDSSNTKEKRTNASQDTYSGMYLECSFIQAREVEWLGPLSPYHRPI